MFKLNHLNTFEKLLYVALFIIIVLSAYFGFLQPNYFDQTFAQEDGLIEYATFVFLFCISILQFYRLFSLGKGQNYWWKLGVFFLALLFLFGAGEEISWGQRIFGIESGEFFQGNNLQKETNLHNLKIGDVKLNKLIFTQLLISIIAIYLLIIPFVYKRWTLLKKLISSFAIPIPKNQHILAFIITTLFIVILPDLSRKWEVFELFFASIFFLIFLNPENKEIILRKSSTQSQ